MSTATIVIALAIWVAISAITAWWARSYGYPSDPLFLVGLVLGPVGWALIWLTVTISVGPRLPSRRAFGEANKHIEAPSRRQGGSLRP